MYRPTIYIEGQRVDLFGDENININSSVQNINDISRVFNDYSESFTVPATPNNNKIFKHWYNYTIDNGFDARIRHDAIIELQTLTFKKGTIRLEGATIENNKPMHYKLTFFGQLIDLKEVIGDDYLSVLDYTEYNFNYSSANVKTGLETGYVNEDFVFPLISTDKQWFYDSDINNITEQDRLANIAWNGSATQDVHGVTWTSLRPALKIMRILEKIESYYGITFSRDFLGNTATEDLYLWLANDDTADTLNNYFRVVDYDVFNSFQSDKGSYNNSTGAYIVSDFGTTFIRTISVRVDSSDDKAYTVQVMNNDTVMSEKSGSGDIDIDITTPNGLDRGSQVYVRIVASAGKVVDYINIRVQELSADTVLFAEKTSGLNISSVTAFASNFTPSMKVIDFLKGIFTLFNLTIVPIDKNNFSVYQLDDWYARGKIIDITPYVDTSKVDVDTPEIYKEISFSFLEPGTILADQFKKTNNTAYGDLETKIKDASGNTLDGGEFEIEVDFEQMVYEKLIDLNTGEETNIVYGLSLSDSLGDTLPESHLLYIRQESLANNNISLIDDVGQKVQLSANVFMPSHANTNKANTTTFGSEIDEHDGTQIENSFFELYYKDYITDSFSIKRRSYKLSSILPINLINTIQLNDRLVINGDRYIINSMSTNITTQMVEFELLNDIYLSDESTTTEEETVDIPTIDDPAPDPTTGTSFSISSTGASTQTGGCALSTGITKYWNGSENNPTLGDTIYNEELLTTVFNGGDTYFKINNNLVINITTQGVVVDVFDCSAQGNQ